MMPAAASAGQARTSIAARLLFGLTATTGLSSALVIGLLALYEFRASNNELTGDITASVTAFAQMIEPALWDVDSARAHRLAEVFARDPRVARLSVHESSNGFTVTVEPRRTADTALRVMEVRHGPTVVGDVTLAFDRGYYRGFINQQLLGAIGVSLIALAATLIAFRILFRKILKRPLDELSVGVRRYGENSYQPQGLDLPYTEFDELKSVLASMSLQVRDHFRALGAANRELGALNRFLTIASADIDPRALVSEAARELARLFDATVVRAEIAPEHGAPDTVIEDPGRSAPGSLTPAEMELPIAVSGLRTGVIALRRGHDRPFTAAEATLANAVAAQVAAAISRYRARSGERLLRTAIEQLPECVVVTDSAMRMVYVNPAFTAATGYTSEEARGRMFRDLQRADPFTPEDDDVVMRVASGETYVGRLRNRRKSGQIFFEDTVITPVRDENGVIINYVSVSRDVTAEMEREERFRHSQRMDAVGQLAGGVAHDFNNMLAVVMMQLDLLESELRLSPQQVLSMKDMRDALDRAANLTRQLLMFSRRQAMRVETHDLDAIVEQMLRILRRVIGEKIEVTFSHGPAPVAFDGDAGMIEQVILNLCVNARDAMPQGGRLMLSTGIESFDDRAEHPGRWARLTVTDTGTGMSDEVKHRLFEPFFTTKDVGHGTGLGLATTHGIVAQHRGWIRVDSTLGHGATFHVYLPATEHAPSKPETPPPRAERQGGATVLVVEDEEAVRRIVTRSLRQLGHRVLEASTAPEAMQLVQNDGVADQIDLVLTDMVMPQGMSGAELITELRRSSPHLRAIVMSGYSLQLASDAQSADFSLLSKPFSLDALNSAVAEALR